VRFQAAGRGPGESVNYVVSHDGFTLRDLVSYDLRHNEANGEGNRDGHGHNLSWNCGFEGESDDPEIRRLRARLTRALLATLLFSQGTPMLAGGDELGHTQGGNNNPYCQDNATAWIDWPRADTGLIAFTARLLRLRREHLPLGRYWYTGLADERGLADLTWVRRDGRPLEEADWHFEPSRVLGALIGAPGRGGRTLLLLFNAEDHDSDFLLPGGPWRLLLDSAAATVDPTAADNGHTVCYRLQARSVVLLQAAEALAAGTARRARPQDPGPTP
jgi:glycogen operon protein